MQAIPVIDLKNGVAVHAVKGQREHYQPLVSVLSDSPHPIAILQGLLRLHPFRSVYLADLDALAGNGKNGAIIQQLLTAFPAVEFWIDRGWPGENADFAPNRVPVLGSESMTPKHLALLPRWRDKAVLSLDYFADGYAGPPALLAQPERWPPRVILMTLGRVGSQAGPDWQRLGACLTGHPQARWIAAGGVRHADDLRRLSRMGAYAALIATALYNGSIDGKDLAEYS